MNPINDVRGISFQPPGGHLWPWLLLAVALIAFAIWTYRRNPAPLSGRFRTLLWVLRGLAFTILLLLICRPLISLGSDPKGRRWVAVLLDTSESLTLPAGTSPGDGTGSTRADQARTGMGQILPGLKDRHTVRVYGFDRLTRPLPDNAKDLADSDPARPRGDITSLGPSIETAVSEIGRSRTGAVVIVSDGVANHGLDPVAVARRLAVPIYAVGVGRDTVDLDAALARLRVNRTAFLGDEVPLAVIVTNNGMAGRSAEITVWDVTRPESPETVARQALTWAGDGAEQEIRLKFRPSTVGLHFYEVRLPEIPGEFTLINNRRMFALDVREEKSRVFMIAGSLSWETTFLKRVLDADSSLSVTGIAKLGGNWRRLERAAESASVPSDAAALGKYALVALVDVDARDLPQATWTALAAWARRGGGLLVIGGGLPGGIGKLAGTPIAPILPVDPTTGGNGSDGLIPFLSASGQRHPVTLVDENEAENLDLWKDLPPLEAASIAPNIRGGAEVLVSSGGVEDYPLLVAGRSGGGKVLAAPASGYWKWDFRVRGYGEKEGFYGRLWTNAVRWLTSPDLANRLLVEPGKPVFERGESIDFSARLSDRDYQPVDGAEITVTITATDSLRPRSASLAPTSATESPNSRTLTLPGGGGGFYSGETSSLPPGRYRYRAEARLNGASLGDVTGIFAVETMGLEFRRPAADLAFLQRLAAESGGRLFTGDNVRRLPEELEVQGASTSEVVLLDIWDSPWFFVILVGLLSAEWFLRRRRGMV